METAKDKAKEWIKSQRAIYSVGMIDSLERLLKEQDRDTRHACAEACITDETHTNNEFFHDVCMNVKAV